jgi:hypothetical protein
MESSSACEGTRTEAARLLSCLQHCETAPTICTSKRVLHCYAQPGPIPAASRNPGTASPYLRLPVRLGLLVLVQVAGRGRRLVRRAPRREHVQHALVHPGGRAAPARSGDPHARIYVRCTSMYYAAALAPPGAWRTCAPGRRMAQPHGHVLRSLHPSTGSCRVREPAAARTWPPRARRRWACPAAAPATASRRAWRPARPAAARPSRPRGPGPACRRRTRSGRGSGRSGVWGAGGLGCCGGWDAAAGVSRPKRRGLCAHVWAGQADAQCSQTSGLQGGAVGQALAPPRRAYLQYSTPSTRRVTHTRLRLTPEACRGPRRVGAGRGRVGRRTAELPRNPSPSLSSPTFPALAPHRKASLPHQPRAALALGPNSTPNTLTLADPPFILLPSSAHQQRAAPGAKSGGPALLQRARGRHQAQRLGAWRHGARRAQEPAHTHSRT